MPTKYFRRSKIGILCFIRPSFIFFKIKQKGQIKLMNFIECTVPSQDIIKHPGMSTIITPDGMPLILFTSHTGRWIKIMILLPIVIVRIAHFINESPWQCNLCIQCSIECLSHIETITLFITCKRIRAHIIIIRIELQRTVFFIFTPPGTSLNSFFPINFIYTFITSGIMCLQADLKPICNIYFQI